MKKKNNQIFESHLLCFDPVYKKEDGSFKIIALGGDDSTTFTLENGCKHFEDGSVELSIYKPEAKSVAVKYYDSVDFDFKCIQLEKGEDGYFRKTVNMGTGYHDVFYTVDGVETINTKAPYGYDGYSICNFVDTYERDEYLLQNVPHGRLTREVFYSEVTGRYRCCWVYTPYSYYTGEKRYPVVYIQHGGMEDEVCWFQSGKVDVILDNLIAHGEVEEMIVVANSGYCYKEVEDGQFIDVAFDEMLAKDCVPFIDEHYRTVKDRHHRATAGLSMGASQARRSWLNHRDLFANAGCFSSGEGFPVVTTDYDHTDFFNDVDLFNSECDVVFVSCGLQDPRIDKTTMDVQSLQEQGNHITFMNYPGTHQWNVWRNSFIDYAKLLFKK